MPGRGGVKRGEIARIVCGAGPGSFTSLRIAGVGREGSCDRVRSRVVRRLVAAVDAWPARSRRSSREIPLRSRRDARRAVTPRGSSLESGGSARQTGPAVILSARPARRDRDEGARPSRVVGPGQPNDAGPHAERCARRSSSRSSKRDRSISPPGSPTTAVWPRRRCGGKRRTDVRWPGDCAPSARGRGRSAARSSGSSERPSPIPWTEESFRASDCR